MPKSPSQTPSQGVSASCRVCETADVCEALWNRCFEIAGSPEYQTELATCITHFLQLYVRRLAMIPHNAVNDCWVEVGDHLPAILAFVMRKYTANGGQRVTGDGRRQMCCPQSASSAPADTITCHHVWVHASRQ